MLLNIWVKNVLNGLRHQVGTNIYDSLVTIDGKVEYINTNTNGGTHDGDYVFIEPPSPDTEVYVSPRYIVIGDEPTHIVIHKGQARIYNGNDNSDHIKGKQ